MGNGVRSAVANPAGQELSGPEFAGCESAHATFADLQGPEWAGRRYEYWDQARETVWFVREETLVHAGPPARLNAFVERVALARGSPIVTFGPGGLRMRRPDGNPGDIMQPDLSVFVYPDKSGIPEGHFIMQGEDAWPSVVLEVDNTTDTRRGKQARYEAWGIPELWVDVPSKGTWGRPRHLRPGCTIHHLESGRYQEVEESVALPGLRAWEIHALLNNRDENFRMQVAWRVGTRLGAAEGTTPKDDPMGRKLIRDGWEEGERIGLEKGERIGLEKGDRAGAGRSRSRMTRGILEHRGITLSPEFPDHLPGLSEALAAAEESQVIDAAFQATDEADFDARLSENRAR